MARPDLSQCSVGWSCAGLGESLLIDGLDDCAAAPGGVVFSFIKMSSKILLKIAPDSDHVWMLVLLSVLAYTGFRPCFPHKQGHSVILFSSLNELGKAPAFLLKKAFVG